MNTKTQLTPEEIQKGDMQFLLDYYLQLNQEFEELQASIGVLKEEMIIRLDAEGTKGQVVGDYTVTKVTRFNFKPTLDQARELAATKTVESIDTQALKRLHDTGVEIPNTTTTTFVMVKQLEKTAE